MARSSFGWLTYDTDDTDTFVVGAASTRVVDIDLLKDTNIQFIVEGTYAITAATTGLSIEVFYGIGKSDPDAVGIFIPCILDGADTTLVKMSDNSDNVSTAIFPTSSTNETKRTYFTLNNLLETVSRWVRISITNDDPTNNTVVKIYVDL